MASLNPPIEEKAELTPGRVAQIWRAHLMSLLIPSAALAYVWSGPHPWYIAPLFIVPFAIFQWIDVRPRYEMRQPVEPLPEAPFDALVYALTGIHFLILLGLVVLFSHQQVFSIDMVMIDTLHTLDLGLTQDILGNLFWEAVNWSDSRDDQTRWSK